jgi:hypothetical protein
MSLGFSRPLPLGPTKPFNEDRASKGVIDPRAQFDEKVLARVTEDEQFFKNLSWLKVIAEVQANPGAPFPRRPVSPEVYARLKFHSDRHTLLRALEERDGPGCFYCGASEPEEIDHVRSRCHGGSDSIENLVLACWDCNTAKFIWPAWVFAFQLAAA